MRRFTIGLIFCTLTSGCAAGGGGPTADVFHATPAPSQAPTISYQIDEMGTPSGGSLSGVTSGPGGNIWYTTGNQATNAMIGRSSPNGVMTEFIGPKQFCCAQGITAGPDGNVWFSELFSGAIGRITPQGAITEFKGIAATALYSLAVGPDGNIWFAGYSGNTSDVVGKISTSGVITQYPVTPYSHPSAIIAGPDGNMWFTEFGSGKIGRISTSGTTYHEFLLPNPSAGPLGICLGPDGKLWFVENGANKIGNITTGGQIAEFTIPTPNSSPIGIVPGPDGQIWFTERGASKIGAMTVSGAFSETLTPTQPSSPDGIAIGPDKNVWFAEQNYGKLGRVDLNEVKRSDPVYSMINLALASPGPELGNPQAIPLTVTAYDLNGHIISGQYPAPITLTDSDRTGRATLTATVVTSSTENVFVQYAGNYVKATIGAHASGGALVNRISFLPKTAPELALPSGAWNGVQSSGYLWLCLTNGSVGRLTPGGQLTQFPAVSSFGLGCSMIVGSDNNVWFAVRGGHQVGKITATGQVSLYPVENGFSAANMVEGLDGAAWFTIGGYNQVGRIAVDGNQTYYSVDGTPGDITVAADKNMYFIELTGGPPGPGGAIERLNTDGTHTRIKGLRGEGPMSAAPDGNLWFVLGKLIYKMTTGGTILAKYVEPSNFGVFGLVQGSDSSLWFTDQFKGLVGRIDTNGKFYDVPTFTQNSQPNAFIEGPGGTMWFTEPNASQIGNIDPNTF
jgi:streptogramin lyase